MVKTIVMLTLLGLAQTCILITSSYKTSDCTGEATTSESAEVVVDKCVSAPKSSSMVTECSSIQFKQKYYLSTDCSRTSTEFSIEMNKCTKLSDTSS